MISLRSTTIASLALLALTATNDAQRARRVTRAFVDTLETSIPLPTLGTLGGVCVDRSGTIFVANFGTSLWKITPGGQVSLLRNDFILASGNTIAPDGRLIQSDFGRNRVYAIDKDTGQRTTLISVGLNGPVGVAADANGFVYVANCNAQTIRRSGPATLGSSLYASGPLFNCPNGIVLGPSGELYVSNFFDDNVLSVDTAGVVSVFATLGNSGTGGGHLTLVGDELYATKLSSHDLYRITLGGVVDVVAGQELTPGLRDGSAAFARLRFPNGIAADPTGKILYTNNLDGPRGTGAPGTMRIRRILLP